MGSFARKSNPSFKIICKDTNDSIIQGFTDLEATTRPNDETLAALNNTAVCQFLLKRKTKQNKNKQTNKQKKKQH